MEVAETKEHFLKCLVFSLVVGLEEVVVESSIRDRISKVRLQQVHAKASRRLVGHFYS